MARQSETKKKSKTKSSRLSVIDLDQVNLKQIRLIEMSIKSQPANQESRANSEFNYSANIHGFNEKQKNIASIVEFNLWSEFEEEELLNVQAIYFFSFNIDHIKNSKKFVESVVRFSVWPLFTVLAKRIASDAKIEIPELPLKPRGIRWLEAEEASSG